MTLTLTQLSVGYTIAGGVTSKTLTVSDNANVSGTNTGDVTLSGQNYLSISGQVITANAVNLSGTNVTGTLPNAKIATSTANTLAGYDSGGNFGDVAIGSGLSLSSGTLSATGGFTPMPTTVTSGTSASMSANNAYVANNAALVTFTLPSSFAVGDEIIVMGLGAGGWAIAQNASQLIHFGAQVTTTGTGGSLSSTNQYDTIHLKAVVANTTFVVIGSQGNISGI